MVVFSATMKIGIREFSIVWPGKRRRSFLSRERETVVAVCERICPGY